MRFKSFGWLALGVAVWMVSGCSDIVGDIDIKFTNACTSDDGCPAGGIRQWGILGNVCTGSTCDSDASCTGGQQCRVRTMSWDPKPTRTTCEPRLCKSDDACAQGQICEGGFLSDQACAPAALCDSDAQCAKGETCRVRTAVEQDAKNRKTCEPPKCVHDTDCPATEFCGWFGADCTPGACSTAADCKEGEPCGYVTTTPDPKLDRKICGGGT